MKLTAKHTIVHGDSTLMKKADPKVEGSKDQYKHDVKTYGPGRELDVSDEDGQRLLDLGAAVRPGTQDEPVDGLSVVHAKAN